MSSYRLGSITLAEIQPEDLEQLREWRNSPDIRAMMCDQSKISVEQQRSWYESLASSGATHFVARYKSVPIGYVNLKSISEPAVYEAGLYTGDARYRGTVVSFLMALAQIDFAFEQLSAQKLVATVKSENIAAIRFNETLGYQKQREAEGMWHMTLSADAYQVARAKLAGFIR
ncbi:GNAT family N-acetyltransferase [Aliagarivorans marinus]|uniref:GNAT family N-acetyltransferase n=1 Tax=Aliagarivorans marinus TaxID=561965 RepID=UPI0004790E8E|nr:GNAT family N-acetyltransferase [Aliagarivorans marinus]